METQNTKFLVERLLQKELLKYKNLKEFELVPPFTTWSTSMHRASKEHKRCTNCYNFCPKVWGFHMEGMGVLGLGSPIYESLGDNRTFGLGLGEGIGP